jgi:hypothetical protein
MLRASLWLSIGKLEDLPGGGDPLLRKPAKPSRFIGANVMPSSSNGSRTFAPCTTAMKEASLGYSALPRHKKQFDPGPSKVFGLSLPSRLHPVSAELAD